MVTIIINIVYTWFRFPNDNKPMGYNDERFSSISEDIIDYRNMFHL